MTKLSLPPRRRMNWRTALVVMAVFGAVQTAIIAKPAYAQTKPTKTSAVPNPADAPVEGYTLPFTPLNGHGGPIVRARINDKVDALFLLDTGSNISTISTELAKKLNLPIKHDVAGAGSTTIAPGTSVSYVTVDSVNVNGLTFGTDLGLLDEIAPALPGKRCDGLLGMNVLKYYAVVFDFVRNEALLITKGNLNETQLRYLGMKDAEGKTAVGSKLQSISLTDLPTTAAQVGKATGLTVTIDSGSPFTFVTDPKKQIEKPAGVLGISGFAYNVGRTWEYETYPFPLFATGDTPNAVKQNSVSPFECGIMPPDAVGATGRVGIDYLSRFRILLDFPAHKWYLTPVANTRKYLYPTDASRQSATQSLRDLTLTPSSYGVWSVVSTDKDGLFGKKGVLSGDLLDNIDGESMSGKQYSEIFTAFFRNLQKNYKTDMHFLRGQQTITAHLETDRP